ncbi:MAG: hypothetical protein RL291_1370, partial [Pseudomonadota bacterium]
VQPSTYSTSFYDTIAAGSGRSAEIVLPIVFDLVKPKRVLDVGCGTGGWLKTAEALGATEIAGVDGAWVDRARLAIPEGAFKTIDFEAPSIDIGTGFDLAICLEVLEHLTDEAGRRAVAAMCHAAPAVLCGAAIPGQGGNNHINERWQSYWAKVFQAHGFDAWDVVRPRVWEHSEVEYWYRQNTILYVHPRAALTRPADARTMPLDVAHPVNFAGRTGELVKFRSRYDKTLKRRVGNAIRKLRGKRS